MSRDSGLVLGEQVKTLVSAKFQLLEKTANLIVWGGNAGDC